VYALEEFYDSQAAARALAAQAATGLEEAVAEQIVG
ncbi:MAG: nuclear transport factor 2 family protein, partial [Mesorhizobium sp.]